MSLLLLIATLSSSPVSVQDWTIYDRIYTCGLKSTNSRGSKEWHFYSLFVSGNAVKNTVVFRKLVGLSEATEDLPAHIKFENISGDAVFAGRNIQSIKFTGVSIMPTNAYTLLLSLAEPLRRNVKEFGVKISLQFGRTKSLGTCEFSVHPPPLFISHSPIPLAIT